MLSDGLENEARLYSALEEVEEVELWIRASRHTEIRFEVVQMIGHATRYIILYQSLPISKPAPNGNGSTAHPFRPSERLCVRNYPASYVYNHVPSPDILLIEKGASTRSRPRNIAFDTSKFERSKLS